jgi:hypothetical protein
MKITSKWFSSAQPTRLFQRLRTERANCRNPAGAHAAYSGKEIDEGKRSGGFRISGGGMDDFAKRGRDIRGAFRFAGFPPGYGPAVHVEAVGEILLGEEITGAGEERRTGWQIGVKPGHVRRDCVAVSSRSPEEIRRLFAIRAFQAPCPATSEKFGCPARKPLSILPVRS